MDKIRHHGAANVSMISLVSKSSMSVGYFHPFKYTQIKYSRRKVTVFPSWIPNWSNEEKVGIMALLFPNLTNFLASTDKELPKEDTSAIAWHLKYLYHLFHKYFPVPDWSKNWIINPFSVNVNELEVAHSRRGRQVHTDIDWWCSETAVLGPVPSKFLDKQIFHNYQNYQRRAMKALVSFVTTHFCEKSFPVLIYLKINTEIACKT